MSRANRFAVMVALTIATMSLVIGCSQTPAAPAQSSAPQVNWVLQTSETTLTNPFSAEYVEMARKVASRTDGKFNIRMLVAKEIGIDRDEFPNALSKGTVDMAWLYSPVMSGIYPFLGVFDLPSLTTDMDSTYKVDAAVKPMLDDATKDSGYMIIPNGWFPFFPQDIITASPVNLADLKGTKIRVWRAPDAELIKALGGEPVSMAVAEVYTSMQRGVVQGVNTGPQSMVENSLFEIANNYYAVRLEPGGVWTSVNKKKWDALPADYRKILQEEINNTTTRLKDKYDKEVAKQKQTLADKGVKIIEPSKAEIEAWRKAAQKIWEPWAAKDPKNKQALELAKKAIGL